MVSGHGPWPGRPIWLTFLAHPIPILGITSLIACSFHMHTAAQSLLIRQSISTSK
jgi:hypothetical protein